MFDKGEKPLPYSSVGSLLLVLLALIFFLPKTFTLYQRLFCPIQVQQGDAITLERGRLIAQGQTIYMPSDKQGPYLYGAYPPLFFWTESILMRLGGNPWVPARLLALTGYLGIGLVLGFWAWRSWGKVFGVLWCLLFWLLPTWCRWSTTDRVDPLYIFVNFVSFLLLYQEQKSKKVNDRTVLAAGFLNAIAILLKQSAVSLTMVYLIVCVFQKQWRRGSLFSLAALVPTISFFALEEWSTQGYFLKHTFFWLHTGYHLDLFADFFFHEFVWENGWIALLVLFFLWTKKHRPFLLLLMAVATFEVFSLGREGGAENYWMNFTVYGLFFILESLSEQNREDKDPLWKMAGPVIFWSFLAVGVIHGGLDRSLQVPTPAEIAMKKEAQSFFPPGECLAIDTDLVVMADKRVWLQPTEYTLMYNLGIWHSAPLLDDIRRKRFSSIELYDIPHQYFLPDDVVDMIRKNYHVSIRKYGRVWLFPNRT